MIEEKSGMFYLGREIISKKPLYYEAKDLTTHAVCVGMTGSGKTGLGIAILEEAALHGIPSIVIDPKGDLGDLLLTFPGLTAKEFEPWVEGNAEEVAKTWKEGLKQWGEDGSRIESLKSAVEMVIYTPANRAGVPLSILSSFRPPAGNDMRDAVISTTSGLLGLLGLDADPIKSREHILISKIIEDGWSKGYDIDIPMLIEQVQNPPFKKIGALDTDTFYPKKDRMALSISLNNLLASPGFQAWMEGERLDIQKLLYNSEGKPKVSILSIAHLSNSERMFFVTILLNEFINWLRKQPGSSNLRALLYMDEIFGYFPPSAMPPSKMPMLTLLKQARAFGVGVVLATQNPVDLDYKGLSNCGTWFIGKLQTDRDKAKVMEGLELGKNGLLDQLKSRVFLMRTVHLKDPVLFETRWTLSYLRGPLTLNQIEKLTPHKPHAAAPIPKNIKKTASQAVGIAKLHFVDPKLKVDVWKEVCLVAPCDDDGVRWEEAKNDPIEKNGSAGAEISPKDFQNYLYQNQVLKLFQAPLVNMVSKVDETEEQFKARVIDVMGAKIKEKMEKAKAKMDEKKEKANWTIIDTIISFITTLAGGFSGRGIGKGTITKAGTSIRKVGKYGKQSQDASQAESDYQAYKEQLEGLDPTIETVVVRPRKTEIEVQKVFYKI